MSDEILLLVGSGVFFIFAFGCYVAARAGFKTESMPDLANSSNGVTLVQGQGISAIVDVSPQF